MSPLPLAIFGSIHFFELLVIGGAALMVFGPRLPEVALRVVAHVMRARRAVSKMWRDTGLEEELRRVRRDIELSIPRDADFDIRTPLKKTVASTASAAPIAQSSGGSVDAHDDDVDPDADRAEPFDSSVTIEPADDIVSSDDSVSADEYYHDHDVDPEADRREPEADGHAEPSSQPFDEGPKAAD